MKKTVTEGGKLRSYLKANDINQEELAAKLDMTRQGLQYHLAKAKLDHEFKVKVRKVGVKAFDENGNWASELQSARTPQGNPFNLIPADADIAEARKVFDKLAPLVSRYVESLLARVNDLDERVKLLQELGELKDEKIRRLEQELNGR